MTTQHIALNGQSVPDALHERMCELQQSQSRYRNPFFHPDFINAVSGVQDNVHLFWEEDDQGLVFFWAMQISRLRTGRGIGGPFADRNGPILRMKPSSKPLMRISTTPKSQSITHNSNGGVGPNVNWKMSLKM